MLLYMNMKNYKSIAYTDFVNVNIALNLHSYEENQSFTLEFIKKMYLLMLLSHKIQDTCIQSYHDRTCALHTTWYGIKKMQLVSVFAASLS